ncbi:MAG: zf-HC2 domain-containing protein [Planctomycetaceae bacterium]
MHCKRAKTEIALWVGNDLDAVSIGRLQRHLAICPSCREHWQGMTSSLRALHDSGDSLLLDELHEPKRAPSPPSVWPAVAVRLASPDFQGPAGRFNGWIPAIAVAAIFLAMVSIANTARMSPIQVEPRMAPINHAVFPAEQDAAGGVWFVADPADRGRGEFENGTLFRRQSFGPALGEEFPPPPSPHDRDLSIPTRLEIP